MGFTSSSPVNVYIERLGPILSSRQFKPRIQRGERLYIDEGSYAAYTEKTETKAQHRLEKKD